MSTATTLRVRFPEVSDSTAYPDALLTELLAEAAALIRSDLFIGADYDAAQQYLAMHLLFATSGPRGQGVQSVSAGPASVTYGGTAVDFNSTGYGAHYSLLLRLRVGSMVV